jgi:hypothetical protein
MASTCLSVIRRRVARSRAQGRAVGDTVQEAGQGLAAQDRACLARQDQKSRLKSIFGVLPVSQDTVANAQDHWSMPVH